MENMTFKELRKTSGMNKTEFAKYFNIPYRTIQNWELGERKCPEYLLELMHYKLKNEGVLLVWKEQKGGQKWQDRMEHGKNTQKN